MKTMMTLQTIMRRSAKAVQEHHEHQRKLKAQRKAAFQLKLRGEWKPVFAH